MINDMLKNWMKLALECDASHVIVAYDSYDKEEYPIYVVGGNIDEHISRRNSLPGQKVIKVIEVGGD